MFPFRHDKAALARSRINNMGVTGQSLPPPNDFEHARGLRNSAYAVNLTYDRHTYRHNNNMGEHFFTQSHEATPT